MNFDPITGQPIDLTKKAAPAPINTRTFLYHKTRAAIVVEGKGDTDAAKRADVAAQIKAKQAEGYTLTVPDDQHPHGKDDHRVEHLKVQTENAARNKDTRHVPKE